MSNIKFHAYKSVSQSGSVISTKFCPPGSGFKRQNNNHNQKKLFSKCHNLWMVHQALAKKKENTLFVHLCQNEMNA